MCPQPLNVIIGIVFFKELKFDLIKSVLYRCSLVCDDLQENNQDLTLRRGNAFLTFT